MIQNILKTKGALLILVLIFGAMFFVMISGFMGVVVTQSQLQEKKYQQEQAREIAEAGLNYYKWFLAHNPDDVTNGTGTSGPYVMPYSDPELGAIGEYSLAIASSTYCGDVASIEIESTGSTYKEPGLTRTVYGRYARPTVAEYAYIINSNVWAGGDRTIVGPYHSNGVIRMDGTNNSTVTSGQEDWVCDGSMSCAPGANGATVDAVYGDGPNSALWNFPSPPINFTGLTLDLANMKTKAQAGVGGIFIPNSGDFGYRVDFQSDGTVDVYKVDQTWVHSEYNPTDGVYNYGARDLIRDDDPFATYTIDANCPLIFIEDKVWLEGEVNQKVTIAAAGDGGDWSMILHNDITYTSTTSGLLAVAEKDVRVGYDVPNNMTLNGIFVAQDGRFGRNYYWNSTDGGDRYRNSLTINGTIVSNGRVGTKWTCGAGVYCSGFNTRFNSYDRDLVDNPPPLAPNTSDDFKFVEWREMD